MSQADLNQRHVDPVDCLWQRVPQIFRMAFTPDPMPPLEPFAAGGTP